MLKEIGSDFWETPKSTQESQFCIEGIEQYKDIKYYISGRSAIRAFIKNVEGIKKRILIPGYTCETVIVPFEKDGWEIVYYPIRKDLAPDDKAIIRLIESFEPSVLLLQSYMGFHTLNNIDDVLKLCKEKQIVVVEDLTQCLFSAFEKSTADFYVSSLRKFIAIPEGGVLVSNRENITIKEKMPYAPICKMANEAFLEKKRYIEGLQTVSKENFLHKYSRYKEIIKKFDDVYQMNQETMQLLNCVNQELICEKRRRNYKILHEGLQKLESIICVFDKIDEQEVPLYFPIYVKEMDERRKLQSKLAEADIYCPVIWPQYIKNEQLDEESQYIYNHILCIPCDQRYGEEEMDYIIGIFRKLDKTL